MDRRFTKRRRDYESPDEVVLLREGHGEIQCPSLHAHRGGGSQLCWCRPQDGAEALGRGERPEVARCPVALREAVRPVEAVGEDHADVPPLAPPTLPEGRDGRAQRPEEPLRRCPLVLPCRADVRPFRAQGGRIPWAAHADAEGVDRKSTRLNSSHGYISY